MDLVTREDSLLPAQKGTGYTIEAFVAILTILIFAIGSLQSPPDHDWDRFQQDVSAHDISYLMEDTGLTENLLERSETGSLQTVTSALTESESRISGTIEGIPSGEKNIGFHVSNPDYITVDTASNLGDKCHDNNELSEIDSEHEVLRTENEKHGVHIYLGDTDPETPGDFDNKENYDSLWVGNGTKQCQLSPAAGPYYRNEFFRWGNKSEDYGRHYDFKNASRDTGTLVLYEANQTITFRNTMREKVNGIETDTEFDTFNFSSSDLGVYDVLVFREKDALNEIDSDSDKRNRLLDFLEDDGSVLFLVNLEENDFKNSDLMQETGMKWKDLGWSDRPSGASFSDTKISRETENFFKGQSGDESSVSMLPGGNITSNQELAHSGSYDIDEWNATNTSMIVENNPPPGTPESTCNEYRKGNFSFPESGEEYFAYSSNKKCGGSDDVWVYSINTDRDSEIDDDEKILVKGDNVEIDGKEYQLKVYSGSEAEFVYAGGEKIEIINYRTKFKDRSVEGFARAGYEDSYNEDERKLLAAVIYQLSSEQNSFGPEINSPVATNTIGSVENDVYMPYKLSMRWEY